MNNKPTTYRVQKLVRVRPRAGDTPPAPQWVTIATKHNKADAERAAMHAQIDNPRGTIRLEEGSVAAA